MMAAVTLYMLGDNDPACIQTLVIYMSSSFFTTDDGDIILRAGPEPESKHDFRVHKFVLSRASPVFNDMLAFPQPSQEQNEQQHQLPFVDILEPPRVIDLILRFVYPGVESPQSIDRPTLSALLVAADKYCITSIYPILRQTLKTFIRRHPVWVYVIANRFGFSEEVREAARKTGTQNFWSDDDLRDELQYISGADLFRLVEFVHERERQGLLVIRDMLDSSRLEDTVSCKHTGEDVKTFYFQLEKEVERTFVSNPCVEAMDLLYEVLDRIPDPPRGCQPSTKPADWHYGGGDLDAFDCPLKPMTIRRRLRDIADNLKDDVLLHKFFGIRKA